VSVLASYFLLPSSIGRVDQIPVIAEAAVANAEVGKFVEYPTMDTFRFISEYVGFGLWVYLLLAAIVATQLWTRKDNFPKDRALWILLVMCIPLAFMTFSPFALNADRTAKLLVGILTILATVIITNGLAMRNDKRLYGISGFLVLISLAYELPKLVPYWMNMGSWE
jgi:tellurite resistance protein TehA-like permease